MVKESACNVGDLGSIPGSGRFPWRSNGNPLQYLCLQNRFQKTDEDNDDEFLIRPSNYRLSKLADMVLVNLSKAFN